MVVWLVDSVETKMVVGFCDEIEDGLIDVDCPTFGVVLIDGSTDGDETGRFVVLSTGSGLLVSLVGWVGFCDEIEDGCCDVLSTGTGLLALLVNSVGF